MPSSARVRAATLQHERVVGYGGVSRDNANALRAACGVELVALADVYEPNLRVAGTAYGIDHLSADLRVVTPQPRPQAVPVT